MLKSVKEFFKKKNKPESVEFMATIVLTMNTKTGDLRVQGNVLRDLKLSMMMLIEAGHKLINEPIKETVAEAPSELPPDMAGRPKAPPSILH